MPMSLSPLERSGLHKLLVAKLFWMDTTGAASEMPHSEHDPDTTLTNLTNLTDQTDLPAYRPAYRPTDLPTLGRYLQIYIRCRLVL